jgi:putative glutamine amidotransferase
MIEFTYMRKPLIGLTAGEVYNRDRPWSPLTYGQSHTYIDSVIKAGGIPIVLPLTFETDVIDEVCSRLDGLLLCGGNDLNPELYGQKPHASVNDISKRRDEVEWRLLDNALKLDLPILAVCRGLQLLNIFKGGTLIQDIKSMLPNADDHESSTTAEDFEHLAHTLQVDPNSKLGKIVQSETIRCNTHHHQAIDKLGQGLVVTSKNQDGIIETAETEDDKFIIGIQAHPESLTDAFPEWQKLFEEFIRQSSLKTS